MIVAPVSHPRCTHESSYGSPHRRMKRKKVGDDVEIFDHNIITPLPRLLRCPRA